MPSLTPGRVGEVLSSDTQRSMALQSTRLQHIASREVTSILVGQAVMFGTKVLVTTFLILKHLACTYLETPASNWNQDVFLAIVFWTFGLEMLTKP